MNEKIDLGHGHFLEFTQWAPDRELNPQFSHLPDVKKFGAFITHLKPDGNECHHGIIFDTEISRQLVSSNQLWKVESWEPLTILPSLLCMTCGDHGLIKNGKWVKV